MAGAAAEQQGCFERERRLILSANKEAAAASASGLSSAALLLLGSLLAAGELQRPSCFELVGEEPHWRGLLCFLWLKQELGQCSSTTIPNSPLQKRPQSGVLWWAGRSPALERL